MTLILPNRRRHHSGAAPLAPDETTATAFAWYNPRAGVYENAAGTDACEDGDVVLNWSDQANSHNLDTVPAGYSGMLWTENGGESYMEWGDTTNRALEASDATSNYDFLADGSAMTVVAAYWADYDLSATGSAFDIEIKASPVSPGLYALNIGPNEKVQIGYSDGDVAGGFTVFNPTEIGSVVTPDDSAWHVIMWRLDGANPLNVTTRFDGVETGTASEFLAPNRSATAANRLIVLGSIAPSTKTYRCGDIVVYDSELGADDIAGLESWFAARYGITLG